MPSSLIKDRYSLNLSDFNRFPVWVRVQDYDKNESWYEGTTEQTYRPWDGPLPLEPTSPFPFVLLAASFVLSSGSSYSGCIQPVTEEWDTPTPPRKVRDGAFTEPQRWSIRHGGSAQSVLALHCPVIFIEDKAYDFHLRRDPELRRQCVLDFYTAIGKRPEDVFPVEFSAASTLFKGIVSGRIEGFYTFPLDKPYEIDRGERYLVNEV